MYTDVTDILSKSTKIVIGHIPQTSPLPAFAKHIRRDAPKCAEKMANLGEGCDQLSKIRVVP